MCIFGGPKAKAPPPPIAPPQVATAQDPAVTRARSDDAARLRAMNNSGSTLLTAGKDLSETMMTGKKTLGG